VMSFKDIFFVYRGRVSTLGCLCL